MKIEFGEDRERNSLENGIYPFMILDAEEKISKAGNEMIAVSLVINAGGNPEVKTMDWLLNKYPQKVKNLLKSAGKKIPAGMELTPNDLRGLTGTCEVMSEYKMDKKFYRINKYLPPKKPEQKAVEMESDLIPF